MTPDEARRLLDGTTPGPWEVRTRESGDVWIEAPMTDDGYGPRQPFEVCFYDTLKDVEVAAAAPTLAAMIAGMREEWGVRLPDGQLVGAGWGTHDTALEDMNAWRRDGYDARIVRRYTTEPEEA